MKSSWSDRPPSSNSPSDQGRKIKRNQGSATFSYCSTSNNSNSHTGSLGNSSSMSYFYDHDLTQQSSSFSYDDGQDRRELAARHKTNQAFDRLATAYAALRFDQAQLVAIQNQRKFQYKKANKLILALQAQVHDRVELIAALEQRQMETQKQRHNATTNMIPNNEMLLLENEVAELESQHDNALRLLRKRTLDLIKEKERGRDIVKAIQEIQATMEVTDDDIKLDAHIRNMRESVAHLEEQVDSIKGEISQMYLVNSKTVT